MYKQLIFKSENTGWENWWGEGLEEVRNTEPKFLDVLLHNIN